MLTAAHSAEDYYFASKYQELYTCVRYDNNEMDTIRREINDSFALADSNCDFIVTANDIINVTPKLNSGKSDGNGGLSTDHYINA